MSADLMVQHARELIGQTSDWYAAIYEVVPRPVNGSKAPFKPIGVALTGAVCPPLLTGKRKGQPNWSRRDRATEQTVIVVNSEHQKWLLAWESANQKCSSCRGDGKEMEGWHHLHGMKFRACRACDGTGQPMLSTRSATP